MVIVTYLALIAHLLNIVLIWPVTQTVLMSRVVTAVVCVCVCVCACACVRACVRVCVCVCFVVVLLWFYRVLPTPVFSHGGVKRDAPDREVLNN